YDSTEHSPWTAYRRQYCSSSGCVTTWRQLYYDDAVSLSRKYDLINRYGLRGAGIWALGYDGTRTELYAKIDEKFATAEADAEPASLSASSRVVTWGRPVTIEVDRGSAEAGTSVDLWASRDRSAWTRIATVTLDAAGRGSVTYTPVTNLYYRLSPLGASEPAAGDEVRVVARQIALLRPTNGGSVATVRRNSSVTFTTTVRPSRPELARATVRFVVYRRLATGWRLVTSRDVVADETGVARLRWTFTSVGDWYVRSMALPTPYNANSVWSPVERYEVDY
ncbi:MAG TPA: hypothetical protein VNJ28_01575, partial [Candidatus Limnocylindrales bacterium]|nr:hypothetical protein [Candidatus Limnocylindrales bacterium]